MENKTSLTNANSGKASLTKADSSKDNSAKPDSGKPNAEYVWKQLEDVVVPRLRLSVIERAIYYHLLRHSRLEGNLRYQFSIASLGRSTNMSLGPVRRAIHRLMAQGALRLIRRSKVGHFVEVRAPEEIRATRAAAIKISNAARLADELASHGKQPPPVPAVPLSEIDLLQTRQLRRAIHTREGGRCFYCLRRQAASMQTLDHVVPRSLSGGHSYLNLVSACMDCNSQKGEKRAEDFLRWLYRERRLTAVELSGRLRALKSLAAGKLRPTLQSELVQSESLQSASMQAEKLPRKSSRTSRRTRSAPRGICHPEATRPG